MVVLYGLSGAKKKAAVDFYGRGILFLSFFPCSLFFFSLIFWFERQDCFLGR